MTSFIEWLSKFHVWQIFITSWNYKKCIAHRSSHYDVNPQISPSFSCHNSPKTSFNNRHNGHDYYSPKRKRVFDNERAQNMNWYSIWITSSFSTSLSCKIWNLIWMIYAGFLRNCALQNDLTIRRTKKKWNVLKDFEIVSHKIQSWKVFKES